MQLAGVQYILDTVVASLAANPDRKFSFAEMVSVPCIQSDISDMVSATRIGSS